MRSTFSFPLLRVLRGRVPKRGIMRSGSLLRGFDLRKLAKGTRNCGSAIPRQFPVRFRRWLGSGPGGKICETKPISWFAGTAKGENAQNEPNFGRCGRREPPLFQYSIIPAVQSPGAGWDGAWGTGGRRMLYRQSQWATTLVTPWGDFVRKPIDRKPRFSIY